MRYIRTTKRSPAANRRGNIIALSAIMLIVVLGFTAFAVDIGFLLQTGTQMQAAADGAALAAALEMPQGWGSGKVRSASQVSSIAGTAAQTVAATYRVGEMPSAYVETSRDVRFGQRFQDAQGAWVESWGTTPYNMVEVSIHRDRPLNGSSATRADQSIPLFFAPAIGTKQGSLLRKATAILSPGIGFSIPPGSGLTCPLLPIAIDQETWDDLINNNAGTDNYTYDSNGTVSPGPDGIKEVNMYPEDTGSPGNRGTVDIGPAGNSTADLSRQIRYGPNESDLAYFGGTLQIPPGGTLTLNGDTGLSAGINDDLAAIIGQPRAVPVFSSVSGNGNNAMYQIVKFVGIRILYVQLTGSPSNKKVIIQPAPVFDGTIIATPGSMQSDSIMAPLKLIH